MPTSHAPIAWLQGCVSWEFFVLLTAHKNSIKMLHRPCVELGRCCTGSSESVAGGTDRLHVLHSLPRLGADFTADCQKNWGFKCGLFSYFSCFRSFALIGFGLFLYCICLFNAFIYLFPSAPLVQLDILYTNEPTNQLHGTWSFLRN
jgi:hypothetical protein